MTYTILDAEGCVHWTAKQCANYICIAPDTWTSYVSHGQAPVPVGRFEGLRLWDAEEVKTWHANRPSSKKSSNS